MSSHRKIKAPSVYNFSENDPAYEASTFGGLAQYKSNKRIKLQNQDSVYRSLHPNAPQIFRGYTVTSLGFVPDSAVIQQVVVKHGGVWRVFKDGGATIIVATVLPRKKMEEMKGKRVVRPEWVTESVKNGKVLEWSKFRVVGEGVGQGRLVFGKGGGLGVADGDRPGSLTPCQISARYDKLSRLLEPAKLPKIDWEIPASDDEGEESEDARDISMSQLPEHMAEEDGAPPCAQRPPKEEYEEEETSDMWLQGHVGYLASLNHQPKRKYDPEDDDDTVRLVDVLDTPTNVSFPSDTSLQEEGLVKSSCFAAPEGAPSSEAPPPTAIIDGEPAYEVEAVIGERKHPAGKKTKTKRRKRQLLVKWKGYGEDEATWQFEDMLRADLGNEVFDEMWRDYQSKKTPRTSKSSQKSSLESKGSSQQQKTLFSQVMKPSSQSSSGKKSSIVAAQVTIQPSQDQVAEKALPTGFSFLPESFSTINLSMEDKVPEADIEPPSPIQSPKNVISPSQPLSPGNSNTLSYQLPVAEDEATIQMETPAMVGSSHKGSPPLYQPMINEIEWTETIILPSLPDVAAGPVPDFTEPELPTTLPSISSTNHVVPRKRPAATGPPVSTPKLKYARTELGRLEAGAALHVPDSPRVRESPRVTKGNVLTAEQFNEKLLSSPDVRFHSVLNPNFLPNFFKESRLHHLSTWKAELRARMQALEEKSPRRAPPLSRSIRYVLHVDFDCFFAAISTRDRPELQDKPVAVCHGEAKNSKSSEIASCNYAAREFGVKNGMWMDSARRLCPDLVTVDYDYDKYKQASDAFYDVALSIGGERLQAVSVDEVLLDVSNLVCDENFSNAAREEETVQKLARQIRDECRKRTGCEVSVGIGTNVLTARLALRKAKPAGQFILPRGELQSFLDDLQVSAFPGIGKHTVGKVVDKFGSDRVSEVRKVTKERLRQTLGEKTGLKLYKLCRGVDETLVGAAENPRETISISINWGVRFYLQEQAEEFIHRLASGVEERMQIEGVKGKTLSFTVGKKAPSAPFQTAKFLGCGSIDTVYRTSAFNVPTCDANVIARKCVELLRQFNISPGNIRGFGIGMKGLEDASKVNGQKQLQFQPVVKTEMQIPERSKSAPKPRTGSELKPAAPVTVRAYVKPKTMTLMDAFGKGKEKKTPNTRVLNAASKVAEILQPETPTSPRIEPKDPTPPGRKLSTPPPLQLRSPVVVPYAPPKYTTPLDKFSVSISRKRQSDVKSLPHTVHKQRDLIPSKTESGIHSFLQPKNPPVPVSPLPCTQFEIPSLSQIDLSVLPFLPMNYQEKVLEQQRAKMAEKELGPELESPPDSQWDVRYWNTFSPTLRDDIRAEVESKKAEERECALARENKLSLHKQKQATLFDRNSSKGKSPSKLGAINPAFNAGPPITLPLNNNRKPSKPPSPPEPGHKPVYDRDGEDVSSWLFGPRETGGAGIDPDLFAYHSRSEQVTIITTQARERSIFLQKEADDRAEAARAREMQENAIVIRSRRRSAVLRLPMCTEVNSNDMFAVRWVIKDWVKATEACDENDLGALCAFIRAVVIDEGRLDKAVGFVQWFLSFCGEKDGWGWTCQRLVDALQQASIAKGRGPVKL